MKTPLKITLSILIIFLVLLGSGCDQRGDDESKPTICSGFQDLETEFWVAAHQVICETLRAKGFRVLERNANQDANRQLEQIRDAIAQDIDLIFTSSDFMCPQIKAVLEPLGKWKPIGDPGHVILGGPDGDSTAYKLMKAGYVHATGVQDLFFEADAIMDALLEAIQDGENTPENWMEDLRFALTQENMAERQDDMWGCKILKDKQTN